MTGPVSVEIRQDDGSLIRRHFDQIRKKLPADTSENISSEPVESEDPSAFVSCPPENDSTNAESVSESQPTNSDVTTETTNASAPGPLTVSNPASVTVRRNPPRDCKAPQREECSNVILFIVTINYVMIIVICMRMCQLYVFNCNSCSSVFTE